MLLILQALRSLLQNLRPRAVTPFLCCLHATYSFTTLHRLLFSYFVLGRFPPSPVLAFFPDRNEPNECVPATTDYYLYTAFILHCLHRFFLYVWPAIAPYLHNESLTTTKYLLPPLLATTMTISLLLILGVNHTVLYLSHLYTIQVSPHTLVPDCR